MLVYGIVLGLPGTVLGLPETAAELGLTLTSRGSLIAALFVGLLLGFCRPVRIVDAIGYRATLALSSGLVALTLPLLASVRTPLFAGAAIVALACRGRDEYRVECVVLRSVSWRSREANESSGYPGGDWRRADACRHSGVICRCVVANDRRGWRWAGTAGRVGLRVRSQPTTSSRRHSTVGKRFAKGSRAGQASSGSARHCFSVAERSGAGRMDIDVPPRGGFSAATATWLLASHWLGLILARVTLSPRVERMKATAVFRSAIAERDCVSVCSSSSRTRVAGDLPFVVGLAIALVVPTMLALSGDKYPGFNGALFGLLLTLLQVGASCCRRQSVYLGSRRAAARIVDRRRELCVSRRSCVCHCAGIG